MADDPNQLEMIVVLQPKTEGAKQIQDAMGRLLRKPDTSPFKRELEDLRKSIKAVSHEIGSVLRPVLGGFTLTLSGVLLGVVAASRGLADFSKGLVELKYGADRVGLSVQQYRGALEALRGVNVENPEAIALLNNMADKARHVRNHIGGAYQEMTRLAGPEIVEAINRAQTPLERLSLIWKGMNWLEKNRGPAYARDWAEAWGVGTKAARLSFEQLEAGMRNGAKLTDDEIAVAQKYLKETIELRAAWVQFTDKVGPEVMEAMTPLVQAVGAALGNKETIDALAKGLGAMATKLGELSPQAIASMGESVGSFIKGVTEGTAMMAEALTKLIDAYDRVEERRAKGEPMYQGNVNALPADQYGPPTPPWDDASKDPEATKKPKSILERMTDWWGGFTKTLGRASGSMADVGDEYQKLLNQMRAAAIGSSFDDRFNAVYGGGGGPGGGESTGDAPFGTGPGGKAPDYFQKQGFGPFARSQLSTVQTPFGGVAVHPQAATDTKEFFEELKKAGAPIKSLGSYNPRRKAFGPGWSSHGYGTAFDVDNKQFPPEFTAWANSHPEEFRAIMKRHHFVQYMPQRDPGHLEWTGPGEIEPNSGNVFDMARAGKTTAAAKTKNAVLISIESQADAGRRGIASMPPEIMRGQPKNNAINGVGIER